MVRRECAVDVAMYSSLRLPATRGDKTREMETRRSFAAATHARRLFACHTGGQTREGQGPPRLLYAAPSHGMCINDILPITLASVTGGGGGAAAVGGMLVGRTSLEWA
jgi:hypothetical protein